MTTAQFRKLALSFESATEEPHFEKASFRRNKKIFATLDEKNKRACLMLSPKDQDVFCVYDKTVMYPVPNKWGLQGATFVELGKIPAPMLKDALTQAYNKIQMKEKTKASPKPETKTKAKKAIKMTDEEQVEQFMEDLKHPLKAEINAVRDIIKGSNIKLQERVKWNAPSYHYEGTDLVTFNPRSQKNVHLVFHNIAIVKVKSELLEGTYKDRRMTYFNDMAEVKKHKKELARIMQEYIKLL
jgi:uncharacterized protein YdhG (YjbR/CyaY superfamily)